MNNNLEKIKASTRNIKSEWWLSWPAIIAACFLFWPVGLFLIWKKTSVDKKAALFSGKIVGIFGWVSVVFAVLVIVVGLSEGFASDDAPFIIFFILAGVGLIFLGKKITNSASRSKKYISIIVNDEITDLDNIAAAVPTTYDNARKDIQKMIDKGFFEGAYINDSERKIVMPKKHQEPIYNQSVNSGQTIKMQVVTCKGCGAQNSIAAGTVSECEFCGSKIEA